MLKEVIEKLKKFYGIAPYDGDTNFVKGDSWFLDSIYETY